MNRFTLKISADDLLDLFSKQRARYSGKLDHTISESDYMQTKTLIDKLEELQIILDTTPVACSEASVTIDIELSEIPVPSLPRGML